MKHIIIFRNRSRLPKNLVVAGLTLMLAAFVAGQALAAVAGGLLYATGLTTPSAEIWLPGSLGGHLWVSDRAQGFCRLDPVSGLTSTLINVSTCVKPNNITTGQVVYDAGTNSIYLPDIAASSLGVYRVQYDSATETIGSPAIITAGLIAADDTPQSTALGPDGKLYIGLTKLGRIVRITNPTSNGNPQKLEPVGVTSNGLPAVSLAFVAGELYVAETVNVTSLVNVAQCSGACVAAKVNVSIVSPRGFIYDAASSVLYIADFAHVFRYNVSTKVLDLFADAGILADGSGVLFNDIRSLGINSQNNIFIGENSSIGSVAGQVWLLIPNTVIPVEILSEPIRPLASLKTVPIPGPVNLMDYVKDRTAAIQLGKALFWDVQVGSDNKTACASCHFQGGADVRAKNQIDPDLRGGDSTFQLAGPNYTLQASDFPLTRRADINSATSPITSDFNDVISSQGVYLHNFGSILKTSPTDQCVTLPDSVFNVGGINTRRVEPRNTPSVINAVFNYRNFWDGRANNVFNGVNPFGPRDTGATIWKLVNKQYQQVPVALDYSSLASQAVGPPGSAFEMSCDGRSFADIGRKLISGKLLIPLGTQHVSLTDSVLGGLAVKNKTGLSTTYMNMVQKAFRPEFTQTTVVGNGQYTEIESNFSLFFGLAVQLYESTLVSDNTPFDQFMAGNGAALTTRQQIGLSVFAGQGRCVACHAGPELTKASVAAVSVQHTERMIMGNGGCAAYDNGFYNIGVRQTANDIGLGGQDPFGNPLSETGMAAIGKFTDPNLKTPFGSSPCDSRVNVDGTFKTPSLRNVELNGPYFNNGGQATLRQVVDFYNHAGDFGQQNINNFDPNIVPLGLSEDQKVALVDFLTALTDDRVRWEKAPFDHPELCIPNGQVGDTTSVTESAPGSGQATDIVLCLPAVGASGNTMPLKPFLNLSPYSQ